MKNQIYTNGGYKNYRTSLAAVIWLTVSFSGLVAHADTPSPRSILVLDQSAPLRPWSTAIINAIQSRKTESSGKPISYYVEHLDLFDFGRRPYDDKLRDHLAYKYGAKPFDVILSIGPGALPATSVVRDRPPDVWEKFNAYTLVVFAALLVQVTLICWLIYEHRRSHLAEVRWRNSVAQLTKMNRRATVGEMSASIAHEVNQPLTGISSAAVAALRWLRAETPDYDKALAALELVVAASRRAADIVASVGSMFKNDTGMMETIDINQVISCVLTIVRSDLKKSEVELETQLHAKGLVEGDRIQLQQVVLNLINNAVEAMQSTHPRILKMKTEHSNHGTVIVSIEDNGPGIDPSHLESIFNTTFTTKANGMGIGLSICSTIIEHHDGRIWSAPAPHRGAVFKFELPIKSMTTAIAA